MLKQMIATMTAFASLAIFNVSNAAIAEADLTPIATEVQGDVAVILPWAFGILATVIAATIGFGLVKKFGSKSAS